MAAEEKRINVVVDGNADSLGQEIERVGKRAKDAFKELGFDDVLQEAADNFEKRIEQFEHIMKELQNDRQETIDTFEERVKKTTNQAGRSRVETERDDRLQQNTRATDALRKAMDSFIKKLQDGKVDEQGRPISKSPEDEQRMPHTPEEGAGGHENRWNGIGQNIMKGMSQIMRGNIGTGLRGIFGGAGGGGAAAEGAAGGEAAGAGAAGGGMAAAGWIGLIVAAGAFLKKAWEKGGEDLRADNRLRAMGAGRDYAGDDYQYSDYRELGINRTDAKKMQLETMKGVTGLGMYDRSGDANNSNIKKEVHDMTLNRARFETAYGIEQGNQQRLDPFYRQNKQNSTDVVAEMMIRNREQVTSAGGTVLGSLANEKLSQIVKLMEWQKERGEGTDSRLASSLVLAGGRVGGQFGDDRGGEKMGGLMSNISGSQNNIVKSMVLSTLMRKYGNISDALAAREAPSSEDTRMIMADLGKRFGTSESAKLLTGPGGLGLFGSQVDANRFVGKNGFSTTANTIQEGEAAARDMPNKVNKFMDALTERAKNLVLNTDALSVSVENATIYTGRIAHGAVGNNSAPIAENEIK